MKNRLFSLSFHEIIKEMALLPRPQALKNISESFNVHQVVALLGPRQCGKTTLAYQYKNNNKRMKTKFHFFDLEDPEDLRAFDEPKALFENLKGMVIIDEIQRRPELFPVLRSILDRDKKRKILILGSASKDLIRQSSESLAGRISYIELSPFSVQEVLSRDLNRLWIRGGFPRSFLAQTEKASFAWRRAYTLTFLERDVPALGLKLSSRTLGRFWKMLTHYHAQIINFSELGRSLGFADTTVRNYLDLLVGTFLMRELPPWHENIQKRQVKRPKIYFRDSGLFHSLLSVESKRTLISHPKLGASWEGFALEQVIQHFELGDHEIFFWSVHSQGELDLLFEKGGKRFGIEFKFSDAPSFTPSMSLVQKCLKIDHFFCLYPGEKRFFLKNGVEAIGLQNLKKL